MRMYPRYVPQLGLGAWFRWFVGPRDSALAATAAIHTELAGGAVLPFSCAYDNLRTGLRAYFSHLTRARGAGRVLVSSQICAAVPRALEAAGCSVHYVDVDEHYPTPSARQFAAALDGRTAAVIVAPAYGHVQDDWSELLDALGGRALVLDLAQGLGLEQRLALLYRVADAVTYSFGLGKGLDTGGGLVLARSALEPQLKSRGGRFAAIRTLGNAIALKSIIASGLYPFFAHRADEFDAGQGTAQSTPGYDARILALLWREKLAVFSAEIGLARDRAEALGKSGPLAAKLRDTDIYLGRAASHLRQVIRIADPGRRDALIAGLRGDGIDCAPAGEPLPQATCPHGSPEVYPNAARFRSDAIRLPYLGRMSESRFRRFRTILERAVVRHLS